MNRLLLAVLAAALTPGLTYAESRFRTFGPETALGQLSQAPAVPTAVDATLADNPDQDPEGWAKKLEETAEQLKKAASDYKDAIKDFLKYDRQTKERAIEIEAATSKLALLRESLSVETDPKKQKKLQDAIRNVEGKMNDLTRDQARELQAKEQNKLVIVNRNAEIPVKIEKAAGQFAKTKAEISRRF